MLFYFLPCRHCGKMSMHTPLLESYERSGLGCLFRKRCFSAKTRFCFLGGGLLTEETLKRGANSKTGITNLVAL